MPTDTSEKGLETLIVESLVNEADYQQGTGGLQRQSQDFLPYLWFPGLDSALY